LREAIIVPSEITPKLLKTRRQTRRNRPDEARPTDQKSGGKKKVHEVDPSGGQNKLPPQGDHGAESGPLGKNQKNSMSTAGRGGKGLEERGHFKRPRRPVKRGSSAR